MLIKKLIPVFLLIVALISCNSANEKSKELIIFHAGSLSVPFREIVAEYQKENPDVNISMESAGSRQCARKITDLKRQCDIMASADYKVIDNLLIPDFADWDIKFAGNEMAIVYHEKSRYSDQINKDNWHEVLMKKDVVFGRSNPDFDPCGYRAVLVMKLAETFYKQPGLAKQMLEKDLNYIRPKEVDLIGLLETDAIDYIFLYRSVAEQHGLKYLILPDSINLKNPDLADYYATATVDISGKKPGETLHKKGEAMVYGLTIINNSPNKEEAIKFVKFLLSAEKGMAILEKNGQQSLVPSPTASFDKIPLELKSFASESKAGGSAR
jgi:molybdate/tungstate transport system substrate-binding protein